MVRPQCEVFCCGLVTEYIDRRRSFAAYLYSVASLPIDLLYNKFVGDVMQ